MKMYLINNVYIMEWPEFKEHVVGTERVASFAVAEIVGWDATIDKSQPDSSPILESGNMFFARYNGTMYNINDYKEGGAFYLGKTLREAHDRLFQLETEDRKNG